MIDAQGVKRCRELFVPLRFEGKSSGGGWKDVIVSPIELNVSAHTKI